MTDVRKSFESPDGIDDRDFAFHPADPDAAHTLTPTQVRSFDTLGFVSPVDAFDQPRADQIATYFDDLIGHVLAADDRRNAYSINLYQLVCQGIYDLILDPMLLDPVEDLIGPDFVCWGSHLFCKLPGDRKDVPLHQDAAYWPFTPTHSVTVWLAIDDADEDNAAMTFAPGSHLHGALEHTALGLDGTRVLARTVTDPAAFPERFVNRLRRGQISLHNDLLLHGSPPNTSTRRRAGFTIRYAASHVDTVAGWDHWKRPSMHCRGNPGTWPHLRRPTGEDPDRLAEWAGDFDGEPLPDAN